MQQCQHEKSQFCTVPGSPANLTKQGLLAVQSTRAHPGNRKMKAKNFRHTMPSMRRFGSVLSLCPGNFNILVIPLPIVLKLYAVCLQLQYR